MSLISKVYDYYRQIPDKSDFIPTSNADNITMLYCGEEGYEKAYYMVMNLGNTMDLDASKINYKLVEKEDILTRLEEMEGAVEDIEESDEDLASSDSNDILLASYDEAPIIRLINQIIINAVKNGASDVHIEGTEVSTIVRIRIDGKLQVLKTYPRSVHDSMLARIKVIASLDVAESRRSQDGRINLKVGNRTIDIRVSIVPSVDGEKAVLRILERSSGLVSLENVGMQKNILEQYRPYLRRTNGIILVTGPTGSGKSTTLYASLLDMDRDDKNILTIEDPVEYHINGVTQVQVNSAVDLTFATALRAFLRQDPDIILVGEIRDEETAEAAVQASLTGHLVLSTLHTNSATATISRLLEMNIEPFLISTTLSLIVAQRLVRRICENCKVEIPVDDAMRTAVKGTNIAFNTCYKGAGCSECLHIGYKGRVALFEILEITDALRNLITQKAPSHEIRSAAVAGGFKSMMDNGLDLVQMGLTTMDEVIANTILD